MSFEPTCCFDEQLSSQIQLSSIIPEPEMHLMQTSLTGPAAPSALNIHTVSSISIAQALCTDALHCIFAFLHLREPNISVPDYYRLLPGILTCKSWYRAALTMKCMNSRMEWCSSENLQSLCSSRMRFHITALVVFSKGRLDELALIRSKLSHLQDLRLVRCFDASMTPLSDEEQASSQFLLDCFPPGLSTLKLIFSEGALDFNLWQLIINALPSAPYLTEVGLIPPPEKHDVIQNSQKLNLSPMLQNIFLAQFQWGAFSVRMNGKDAGCPMSLEQLAVIKQIPSLTYFKYNEGEWSEEEAATAFSPPHRLQNLNSVQLTYTEVNSAILLHLSNLPSLTELHPMRVTPDAYPLLSRFTQLMTLELSLKYPTPTEAEMNTLCIALQSCSLLSYLVLKDVSDVTFQHSGIRSLEFT